MVLLGGSADAAAPSSAASANKGPMADFLNSLMEGACRPVVSCMVTFFI